jgi:hypothetical protein
MTPLFPFLCDAGIVSSHYHLRGKKWRLILVLLMLAQPGLGTSILIVYSYNKVIYLAADSLQRDARTGRSWNICKIHESRDMYWAAASDFYNYGRTGFDLKMIVESIGSEGPIISKMERFIKSVTRPLERAMADSKRFDPKTYAKFEGATRTPLQIVFLAIESGEPTFAITTFRPHKVKGRITLTPL